MVISPLSFSAFKQLFFVRSTKPVLHTHFSHSGGEGASEAVMGVALPSQAVSSPGTLEAELAPSEWPEGNQQYPQPLPLDRQGYQIFPAVKTP